MCHLRTFLRATTILQNVVCMYIASLTDVCGEKTVNKKLYILDSTVFYYCFFSLFFFFLIIFTFYFFLDSGFGLGFSRFAILIPVYSSTFSTFFMFLYF
jgi:hypothetical protein